ncbi:MAG TPA: hypothetical protein VJN22_03375 [Candidatus Eremiobacteraceae bacterium]|nr:hypothetical protein [Candidatus Eremiobacteraceae bacterium]
MAPERAPDDFIFKRMTLGLCAGAVVGLLFAIVVAYLRGIEFSSVPVANHPELWPAALGYAVSKSAPMVAIYMTIASISLLREENLVSAAFAILIVMIVFALVGEGFIAPLSPLWLDASIGFWVACVAIYVKRRRRDEQSGWESYF